MQNETLLWVSIICFSISLMIRPAGNLILKLIELHEDKYLNYLQENNKMAFGASGPTQAKPRLACIGTVESVGEPKLTSKGVYYQLPIKIKAVGRGRDTLFRLLFAEHWLKSDFEIEREDPALAKVYEMHIAHDTTNKKTGEVRRTASLQILADENFDSLVAAVGNKENQTPAGFAQAVAAAVVGNAVGYVLKQSKDEAGDLTDFYEVQRFFLPTPENQERQVKKAGKDLVITWTE